jgi:probable phosphoglycerate mutase
VSSPRRVVVEADGGSRGNPGPAAYGALVRDASSGDVIAERAEAIGTATNNVAEYRGLLAGLELAREHAPDAAVEVRMDSKLVIEQMSGRWKIKHPDMRTIAMAASRVLPTDVTWTWVPRERNKAADALVNAALDEALGVAPKPSRAPAKVERAAGEAARARNPMVGWRPPELGTATTMLLLRHGVTDSTLAKLFCGSGGSDPGLNDMGREQVERAARWLDSHGSVDGMTFAQVQERYPEELENWLASVDAVPPGGESYAALSQRVLAAKARLQLAHQGRRVLAVSHVTPIKLLVRDSLDAPMHVIHRMQVAPASVTTLAWWSDGVSALQQFSYVPE